MNADRDSPEQHVGLLAVAAEKGNKQN